MEVRDIAQKEEPKEIEILYASVLQAKKYSDYTHPINCGSGIEPLEKECAYPIHYKEYFSPLKQFESGTYHSEIICNEELELVRKAGSLLPACVNPESIPKLIERGWVSIPHKNNLHETEKNKDIYNYNSYGLRVNFIEIREAGGISGIKRDGIPVSKIDPNLTYDVVSMIQNRDGFEKDFVVRMYIEHPNGDSYEIHGKETISPYGTRIIALDSERMHPGESNVAIHLSENKSAEDENDKTSFSKSFFFE